MHKSNMYQKNQTVIRCGPSLLSAMLHKLLMFIRKKLAKFRLLRQRVLKPKRDNDDLYTMWGNVFQKEVDLLRASPI